eukprot:4812015-Pyramimonas_sp.AAC.2
MTKYTFVWDDVQAPQVYGESAHNARSRAEIIAGHQACFFVALDSRSWQASLDKAARGKQKQAQQPKKVLQPWPNSGHGFTCNAVINGVAPSNESAADRAVREGQVGTTSDSCKHGSTRTHVPIRHMKCRYILTTDQSDAVSAGIFCASRTSRWCNSSRAWHGHVTSVRIGGRIEFSSDL